MLTAPNLISFMRIPLALAFFQSHVGVRAVAILLALLSDGLDGFLARRWKQTTRVGTFLDPFTDRFFVVVAVAVLFTEHNMDAWKIAAMFTRDAAIAFFALILLLQGKAREYRLRAIWCGKLTTVLQLVILLALLLNFPVPNAAFALLAGLGAMALVELFRSDPTALSQGE